VALHDESTPGRPAEAVKARQIMTSRAQGHELHLLPPADLIGEIERLRDDVRAEQDKHLRAQAVFKNYRRRVEQEGDKRANEGRREFILPLLDLLDDMDKALEWTNGSEKHVAQGFTIVRDKCLAFLATHDIRPFASIGTPFDHERHDAVAMVNEEGRAPGTVVDELRRGYLWHDEVVRHAQVRVAG
jgi:molecular chaperone GrpE